MAPKNKQLKSIESIASEFSSSEQWGASCIAPFCMPWQEGAKPIDEHGLNLALDKFLPAKFKRLMLVDTAALCRHNLYNLHGVTEVTATPAVRAKVNRKVDDLSLRLRVVYDACQPMFFAGTEVEKVDWRQALDDPSYQEACNYCQIAFSDNLNGYRDAVTRDVQSRLRLKGSLDILKEIAKGDVAVTNTFAYIQEENAVLVCWTKRDVQYLVYDNELSKSMNVLLRGAELSHILYQDPELKRQRKKAELAAREHQRFISQISEALQDLLVLIQYHLQSIPLLTLGPDDKEKLLKQLLAIVNNFDSSETIKQLLSEGAGGEPVNVQHFGQSLFTMLGSAFKSCEKIPSQVERSAIFAKFTSEVSQAVMAIIPRAGLTQRQLKKMESPEAPISPTAASSAELPNVQTLIKASASGGGDERSNQHLVPDWGANRMDTSRPVSRRVNLKEGDSRAFLWKREALRKKDSFGSHSVPAQNRNCRGDLCGVSKAYGRGNDAQPRQRARSISDTQSIVRSGLYGRAGDNSNSSLSQLTASEGDTDTTLETSSSDDDNQVSVQGSFAASSIGATDVDVHHNSVRGAKNVRGRVTTSKTGEACNSSFWKARDLASIYCEGKSVLSGISRKEEEKVTVPVELHPKLAC